MQREGREEINCDCEGLESGLVPMCRGNPSAPAQLRLKQIKQDRRFSVHW